MPILLSDKFSVCNELLSLWNKVCQIGIGVHNLIDPQ